LLEKIFGSFGVKLLLVWVACLRCGVCAVGHRASSEFATVVGFASVDCADEGIVRICRLGFELALIALRRIYDRRHCSQTKSALSPYQNLE